MMKTAWKEPKLEDLLDDPILDVLLARDRISRDDLQQVVEQARRALALAPRAWKLEEEAVCEAPPAMVKAHPRDFASC
jgi:acetyl-CoA acetyltransferase